MLPLYFLAQILALLCGWPFLLYWRRRHPEKFKRLSGRLRPLCPAALGGFARSGKGPRIWLHALSVGEVSSALPLARAIRQHFPDALLVVTVTTTSGETFARQSLAGIADLVLAAPLDFLPSLWRFLDRLRPDLFIQVETDFWPGLLFSLRRRHIPALLVNGRISAASFRRYWRWRALFRPMFACFTTLAMQTEADRDKLIAFGLPAARLPVLGNLKYAAAQPASANQAITAFLPPGRRLWLCGSTHAGEEEIILTAYLQLRARFPDIFLLLAPRRPERGEELVKVAGAYGLSVQLRSRLPEALENGRVSDLLILDSIGELASCYFLADAAFIGGSLVAAGGHNPLEAAWAGKSVLFGPHMEDFSEIAADLIAAGGARMVSDAAALTAVLTEIFSDSVISEEMGMAALSLVEGRQRGVLQGHIDAVAKLLAAK